MHLIYPYDSGRPYADCWSPFLSGDARPATPEQLMRLRYSAFVIEDVDYLIATCCTRSPGQDACQSYLEFIACFYDERQRHNGFIHEFSRFVRLDERWYYVDGPCVPGRSALFPFCRCSLTALFHGKNQQT
ncbi:hypothetical protein BG74_02420 [Sodalis-like endosymbiont of Proechinophthirus fluctus]|uniref:YchJ family protein n=1 Tax=Sodalis-like endosymbiont of Proechinophthirus fluctus TaxID=1462730 RepID=UPI0007A918C0|nr:YchJ family metal-binding protein [Sodalis-like endosymbiont of Proechinophthirus fluctus]KYP97531.1 hypothetical protein BG74_02420 [Sodalis-like endosymbiont of Proechinophthirus fluctus]